MKYLILILSSSVFFSPCFAEKIRYRLQGHNFAELQAGWVIVDEKLKAYMDSGVQPYVFSDEIVKNGQIIIETGVGQVVFSNSIKAGKEMTGEEQNAVQKFKGKVIMFNNNYASHGALEANAIKMYEEPGMMSDSVERGGIGIKVYQFPLSSFGRVEREALAQALMDGDGPGNGGGSPSASINFYFAIPEEVIPPEQIKQIQEQLAEGRGAFIMSPFYGYNMEKSPPEDESAFFGRKRVYDGGETFVKGWGAILTGEPENKELLQRMLEYAGLAKEEEDFNSFSSAQGWNQVPDVGVGVIVPESYLRDKADLTYKGYGSYRNMGDSNSMGGMGDFSVDVFK